MWCDMSRFSSSMIRRWAVLSHCDYFRIRGLGIKLAYDLVCSIGDIEDETEVCVC